jgi:hypothetical protein
MAALPLRRSLRGSGNLFFLYRRGAAAATYFFCRRGSGNLFFCRRSAAREQLNFWKVFIYFYRKNL